MKLLAVEDADLFHTFTQLQPVVQVTLILATLFLICWFGWLFHRS